MVCKSVRCRGNFLYSKHFNQPLSALLAIGAFFHAADHTNGNNRQGGWRVFVSNGLLQRIFAFAISIPSQENKMFLLRKPPHRTIATIDRKPHITKRKHGNLQQLRASLRRLWSPKAKCPAFSNDDREELSRLTIRVILLPPLLQFQTYGISLNVQLFQLFLIFLFPIFSILFRGFQDRPVFFFYFLFMQVNIIKDIEHLLIREFVQIADIFQRVALPDLIHEGIQGKTRTFDGQARRCPSYCLVFTRKRSVCIKKGIDQFLRTQNCQFTL